LNFEEIAHRFLEFSGMASSNTLYQSSVGVPVMRVKQVKNHLAKSLVLVDLAAARSDVKAEEILYRWQIWSVHPFAETALPGAGLIEDREASLERVFWHF
jgi:hypothetical protein